MKTPNKVILGSRGSQLALWQARHIASRLEALGVAPGSVHVGAVCVYPSRVRDAGASSDVNQMPAREGWFAVTR